MSLETPRQFTQEQAQAMYAALQRLVSMEEALRFKPDERPTRRKLAFNKTLRQAAELLQAIDTQAIATPASQHAASADGARFVVETFYGDWRVIDTQTGKPSPNNPHWKYRTPEIAQAAARALNAGTPGSGGAE